MDRIQARLCRLARVSTRFIVEPEPRTIGSVGRGQQLMNGQFMFAGHYVQARDTSIWDLESPHPTFTDEMHAFGWLDHLAAVGGKRAAGLAQRWTQEWLRRFGGGNGPGWRAEIAGPRLQRMINHSVFLQGGWDEATSDFFARVLAQHTAFLSKRWRSAATPVSRLEALTGLIQGATALEGLDRYADGAAVAVGQECVSLVAGDGGIPSRNPEELLDIFVQLTTAASALSNDGRATAEAHHEAIARIAPALRALRHANGELARFHGGGRGAEGRLDHALAASGVRQAALQTHTMGYVRLVGGRTTLIQDAAPPPAEATPMQAHASTLSFELTSGRRPLIVNCGSGASYAAEWRRAGRATPSHSTLGIDGYSSSRLEARGGRGPGQDRLTEAPTDVRVQESHGHYGMGVLTGHNGYQPTHGLTHVRRLDLSADGRSLSGEDTLAALTETDRRRLMRMRQRLGVTAIDYSIRFHLHPDVTPTLDMGGVAVSLALLSGEVWIFRHDGHATLSVEPSVYFERGRLKPRATRQIVLSARVVEHASQVGWTLAKAQDTPRAVRDFKRTEPAYEA